VAGNLDLRLAAEGRLGEGDLEVVAEIGAALLAVARSAALPEDLAEDVPEDVVDVAAGEPGLEGAGPETAGRLVAEAIVAGALFRIAENLVRLGGLLELLLGDLVAVVLVGVVLDGELAERALQLLRRGRARNPTDLIVIALLDRH